MSTEAAPLEVVILLAAAVGSTGATTASVVKNARSFVDVRGGDRDDDVVRATLKRLHERGWLEVSSAAGARAKRYGLTSEGQRAVESRVGKLPKKPTWGGLRDRVLLPSIVGIRSKAPTFGMLRAHVIARALGMSDDIGIVKTESALLNHLGAVVLGVNRPDPILIREAVIRRWVLDGKAERASGSPVAEEDNRELTKFARDVLAAARKATTGRIGDKVFINHVWRQMEHDRAALPLDVATYHRLLLEANRTRLISLSRADLSPSFPPDDVRESEVFWFGDTFHFVETQR